MKRRILKTLGAMLLVMALVVPAAASPFSAVEGNAENQAAVPQANVAASTSSQPWSEPAASTSLPEAEDAPSSQEGEAPASQGGNPNVIHPASPESIIPAEEIDEHIFGFVWALSAPSTPSGATNPPLMAKLTMNASLPSNISDPIYKGLQVRIYFGANHALLDLETASSSLFNTNFNNVAGTIETDSVTGERYLCYNLGDFDTVITGGIEFPVRFANGVTPNNTQITPTAKLYYVGRNTDSAAYAYVAGLDATKTATATAALSQPGGSVEWYMTNGGNSTAEFNDAGSNVHVDKNYFQVSAGVSVKYSTPNAANALGVLYAKSFKVETVLTLPSDVSFPLNGTEIAPEAALGWYIAGKNVLADATVFFEYDGMAVETTASSTVYTFKATYTPAPTAGNAGNFTVDIRFNRLVLAPSATPSYVVQAETTASIIAVDGTTVAAVSNSGGSKLTITRKPAVPGAMQKDQDLANSLVTKKTVENNATEAHGAPSAATGQNAYNDGDTATFEIGDIKVENAQNTAKIYELRDFTILDYGYSADYMRPKQVILGAYEAQDGTGIAPTGIVFYIGTSKRMYTLTAAEIAAGSVDITDAMVQTLYGGTYTTKHLTAVGIYFGASMQSNFLVSQNPQFKFGINDDAIPAPADGVTLENKAEYSFVNNPTWGSDAINSSYNYTYTSSWAFANIQMTGNTRATVEVTKTFCNVTQNNADRNNIALGDTLRYTITVKNNTFITRAISDPEIRDEMFGGLLDPASLILTSVSLSPNNWSNKNHDNKEDLPHYTSIAPGSAPHSALVTWKFSGRQLAHGQTITLVYTIKVRTAQQLKEAGVVIKDPNQPMEILNTVCVANAGGGGSVGGVVPRLSPRPLVKYGLKATIEGKDAASVGFTTGMQKTVDYTVNLQNVVNEYEGSTDITNIVIAGILPSGFELQTGSGDFVLTRPARPLPAGVTAVDVTAANEVVRYSYRTNAGDANSEIYNLAIYKTGNVYGYTFTIQPSAGGLKGGTATETMELTFKAKTPTDISHFANGAPRMVFTSAVRLVLCDAETGMLNADSGEPLFRYTLQSGYNSKLTYALNSGNWNALFNNIVKRALQASVDMEGSIGQPAIATKLTAVGTYPSGYSGANYGIGDSVAYTFQVSNFTLFAYTPYQNSAVIALPKGEKLSEKDIQVLSSGGQGAGAVAATALSPDDQYNYYKIMWENAVSAIAIRSGNTYSEGWIRVVFRATVDASAASRYPNEFDADFKVKSNAYFMFTSEMASQTRVYENVNKTSALDAVVSGVQPFADAGNFDQDIETEFRLGNKYDHNFRRDRVRPDIQKFISQPSALKDKQTITNTITVGNHAQATAKLNANGYVIEVLPKPLRYNGMLQGTTAGIGEPVAKIETTYDFDNGTGAQPVTILIWKAPNIHVGGSIKIVYSARVMLDAAHKLSEYGDKYSQTVYLLAPSDLDIYKQVGTPSISTMLDPVLNNIGIRDNASRIADALEGTYNKMTLLYAKAAQFNSQMQILGEDAPLLWQKVSASEVKNGQNFNFSLYVQNGSMQENHAYYQNMVLINRLPFANDFGVIDTAPRGSEFQAMFKGLKLQQETEGLSAAPFTIPADKYAVWYLVTPEGSTPSTTIYGQNSAAWTQQWTGAVPADFGDWKLAANVSAAELARVTAFRIEFKADYKLSSRGRIIITVAMNVPDAVEFDIDGTNKFMAYNSFAFFHKKSTYAANNPQPQTVLQPARVGVKLLTPRNNSVDIEKRILNSLGDDITKSGTARKYEVVLLEKNTNKTYTVVLEQSSGRYRASFAGLPLGDYQITETRELTAPGTTIADLYTVTLQVGESVINSPSYEFSFRTASSAGQKISIGIVNKQKPTSIELTKTFSDSSSVADRTFKLVGQEYGGINLTGKTDSSGKLAFTDLPWGNYTLIELVPHGYTPSGFTQMPNQSDAPKGFMYFSKKITLPVLNSATNKMVLNSHTNVLNAYGVGSIQITKTWNSEWKLGENSMPEFYAMPVGATDWNDAVQMVYAPSTSGKMATFTTANLATGRYNVFEIVENRYEPFSALHEWPCVEWWYSRPGYSYLFNRYQYTSELIVQKDQVTSLYVDNVAPPYKQGVPTPVSSSKSTGQVSVSSAPTSSSTVVSAGGGVIAPNPISENSSTQPQVTISEVTPPIVGSKGSWSVTNLIFTAAAGIASIILLLSFFIKKEPASDVGVTTWDEKDRITYKPRNFSIVLKVFSMLIGLLVGSMFFTFSDFGAPVQVLDQWSGIVLPAYLAHLILLVSYLVVNRRYKASCKADADDEGAMA